MTLSRKSLAATGLLLISILAIGTAGLFLARHRLMRLLQNDPSGSYMLDVYRTAVRPSPGANPIPYSIFQKPPAAMLDDPAARAALPEFKVIKAIPDSELTAARPGSPAAYNTWTRSGGDNASTKYSALDQINTGNVRQLEPAWTYRSHEWRWRANVETNPIVVGRTLYTTTPGQKLVAVDAATGVEKWRLALSTPARRGLVWWQGDSTHSPTLFVPTSKGVFAVDPTSGRINTAFGDKGRVGHEVSLVAPVIDGNRLIVAMMTPAVEAYDIGSGKLIWHRSPVILPPPGSPPTALNGGNPWGGLSLDGPRSLVFVSTGNPAPYIYGVSRPGDNAHTSSVVAIDTRTGVIRWAFQEVAHDLWDFDVPAAPVLVTVNRNGRMIDAVATVTKIGNTILLDRDQGRPLFDYRLRRAPASTVPGEHTAPYQPDVTLPEPFLAQEFKRTDVTDISPEDTRVVERKLRDASLGFFAPPAIHRSTVTFGIHGGAEWPGAAVDPASGVLYVPSNRQPWALRLFYTDALPNPVRAQDKAGDKLYQRNCAACHGVNRQGDYQNEMTGERSYPSLVGITASRDLAGGQWFAHAHDSLTPALALSPADAATIANYLKRADRISDARRSLEAAGAWQLLFDGHGHPASKPPWGLLTAIDLNTGRKLWSVPLGEYADLKGRPPTGQPNFGGAIVTKGGLVFATGTVDGKVRAFDARSGRELWSNALPATGSAPPSTYTVDGVQYLVVPASGGMFAWFHGHSDTVVAFRLPRTTPAR